MTLRRLRNFTSSVVSWNFCRIFLSAGTPSQFEIKKSLTQNTVLQSEASGDQNGGVAPIRGIASVDQGGMCSSTSAPVASKGGVISDSSKPVLDVNGSLLVHFFGI